MKAFLLIFIGVLFFPHLIALHIWKESANLHLRPDISYVQPAAKESEHEIIFGIEQRNLEELEDLLYDVSDPDSENYGKHWTKDQVAEFTKDPKNYETVVNFLQSFSPAIKIKEVTLHQEYIKAIAPIEIWERMFSCSFHIYKLVHPLSTFHFSDTLDSLTSKRNEKKAKTDYTVIRTDSYSLPIEIERHVFAAFNTVQFPHPRSPKRLARMKDKSVQSDSSKSNLRKLEEEQEEGLSKTSQIDWSQRFLEKGYVTPKLIQLYYEVYNTTASPLVSQGILESLGEALDPSDLTLFQQYFGLLVQPVSQVIGGHVQIGACSSSNFSGCAESNLDVQYVMAIAQNVPTIYWYVPDRNNFIDWMDFVTVAASSANPADVYSISYTTYEYGFSTSTAKAFNTEAIKLGVMGSTIVAASGDDGVVGFLARQGASNCGYFPQYPASSPYVTAIGGTTGVENDLPEIACQSVAKVGPSITTGGGFSNLYAMPKFQKKHVDDYFNLVNNTYKKPFFNATASARIPALGGNRYKYGYFNRSGRAYPDVSLFASNYYVFMGLQNGGVDGTSASAPVMAAFINLVNYRRVLQGNSTMGWINPFLYKRASMFVNDITVGRNNCSALYNNHQSKTCCRQGFYATPGWDPLTGLGSVNFRRFLNAATGLVLTPSPTQTPTKSPVASPTSILSTSSVHGFQFFDGAYAGIAIGGTFFLLFLGALLYCIRTRCCLKNTKKTAKVMSVVP